MFFVVCSAAVQAFCGGINCGVGGNVSLAMGPMGRQADANMRIGKGGAALCYSYSCSKGIFAGEQLRCITVSCTSSDSLSAFQHFVLKGQSALLRDQSSLCHHKCRASSNQCASPAIVQV